MKNYGLREELPWPQEEVDDNSFSQVHEDTPLSSLDVSVTGEDVDIGEIKHNKGQTTVREMIEKSLIDGWEPLMRVSEMHDQHGQGHQHHQVQHR